MTVFLESTHQLLEDTIMHNIDQLLQDYCTTELYYQVREIAQQFLNDRMANATGASKHHLSMMTADFQAVNTDIIRELSENFFLTRAITVTTGEVTEKAMERIWARWTILAALIAFLESADYDLMIPVLLPKIREMKYFLIQTQNQKHCVMGSSLRSNAMN